MSLTEKKTEPHLQANCFSHIFQYNASDVKLLTDFDNFFWFWLKKEDFDEKFNTIVDSSLEKLYLLDELDNPMTVATLSLLIELNERNGKLNLRTFDEADKDDVEKYLYEDQDNVL